MFPPMYNSEVLAELALQNEGTAPLNKDRPIAILLRKALKFAKRYLRDFLYI